MMRLPRTWIAHDPNQTRCMGKWLGEEVRHPVVVALNGDLGAGKTVLVQGIAQGLAVDPEVYVTSPTYTLVSEYPGRLLLIHADLYRLPGPVDPEELGFDTDRPEGVVAVEWSERLDPETIGDHLKIVLTVADDGSRRLTCTPYGLEPELLLSRIASRAAETSNEGPSISEWDEH